jgi:response regulator of citrate/malate metabolism
MNETTRVLIVDDDEMVLFLHEFYINETLVFDELLKFQSAETALSYLEQCKEESANYIIFLDINMPMLNGWDFLNVLKDNRFDAARYQIIMVTSSIDVKDKERSMCYDNIAAFIEKPFTNKDCERLKDVLPVKPNFQEL